MQKKSSLGYGSDHVANESLQAPDLEQRLRDLRNTCEDELVGYARENSMLRCTAAIEFRNQIVLQESRECVKL